MKVKDPIKIVCVKGSKKLIKGAVYDLISFKKWTNCYTYVVKDAGRYTDITRFTLQSGESLSTLESFTLDLLTKPSLYKPDNLKKGQIIKCIRGTSKYLVQGEYYLVKDIQKRTWIDWTGNQNFSINGIKVNNGQNRFYGVTNFEWVDIIEQRKVKLSNIGGSNLRNYSRNFDRYSDLKKIRVLHEIVYITLKNLENCDYNASNIDLKQLLIENGCSHHINENDIMKYINIDDIKKWI